MGILEAGTWSIPEHLPLVPSWPQACRGQPPWHSLQGSAVTTGCVTSATTPPTQGHPPGAQVPKAPGATASPREAQEPAQGQGQPLVLQAGTWSPGTTKGPSQAMGAPEAPWGSQHPGGQAGRDRASP